MNKRLSLSQWISIVSVLVAVVSLYVAWRALESQERSSSLSRQQQDEARAPVWLASVNEDGTAIVFDRRTGDCVLQSLALAYASPLGAAATEALAPTYSADLRQVLIGIRDLLNTTHRKFEQGKVAKFLRADAPVLINSEYACGGARHTDSAVYVLQVSGLMSKDRNDWPISVNGISFYERLSGTSQNVYSERARGLLANIARFGELRRRK